jgi:hypothetical protein
VKPRNHATSAILVIAILLAAGFTVLFHPVPEAQLVITAKDGRRLAALPLIEGRFDHVFIHSIHLTPVEERFVVEADAKGGTDLRLFELRYQSLGVGMPSDAEGGFRLENGRFILTMNRVFKKIPVMVSVVPGHGVTVGQVFHPFTEWVESEDLIFLTGRMVLKIKSRR